MRENFLGGDKNNNLISLYPAQCALLEGSLAVPQVEPLKVSKWF